MSYILIVCWWFPSYCWQTVLPAMGSSRRTRQTCWASFVYVALSVKSRQIRSKQNVKTGGRDDFRDILLPKGKKTTKNSASQTVSCFNGLYAAGIYSGNKQLATNKTFFVCGATEMSPYRNAMSWCRRLLNVAVQSYEVQTKRLEMRFCLLIVSSEIRCWFLALVLLEVRVCVCVAECTDKCTCI